MKKCPQCKSECNDDTKFCEECGYTFPQTKECPQCHAELKMTAKFCSECGYSFIAQASEAGKGSFVGDKNVISGDVVGGNLDRRVYHGNVTTNNTNNITNNTTSIVNNNIDESRKLVQCHICLKNMTIAQSYTCKKCGKYVCNNCRDEISGLCRHCLEQSSEGEARKMFVQAETLRISRKFDEAQKIYVAILAYENLTKNFAAKVNNAMGLLLSNSHSENLEKIKSQINDNPDEKTLALCNKCIEISQETIEYYKKALVLNPTETSFKSNLENEVQVFNSFHELKKTLERDLSSGAIEARAIRTKADSFFNIKQYDQALELYQKILKLDMDNIPADLKANVYNDIAVTLARMNDELYETLQKQIHNNQIKDIISSYQQLVDRHQKAIDYYKKALEIAPNDKTFVDNLETDSQKLDRYLKLEEMIGQAIRTKAKSFLDVTKQYDQALELFQKILKLENIPADLKANVYNDIAVTLARLNNELYETLEKRICDNPQEEIDGPSRQQLVDRQKQAVEYYKKALEIAPNDKTFVDNLETDSQKLDRYLKLEEVIGRAIRTKANSFLNVTKQYDQALELFQKILKLENISADLKASAYNGIAVTLARLNNELYETLEKRICDNPQEEIDGPSRQQLVDRQKQAVEYYKKALEIAPNNKTIVDNLETGSQKLDRYLKLEEMIGQAIRTKAKSFLDVTKQYDQALELFQKILKLENIPADLKANVYNEIAVTLARLNNDLYETLEKQIHNNLTGNIISSYQKLIDRHKQVIEYCKKALEIAPNDKRFVESFDAANKLSHVYIGLKKTIGIQMNSSQTEELCPKCNTVRKEGKKFCTKCGYRFPD